jgi:hypothetical protein
VTTETELISGPWSWKKRDIRILKRNYKHGNIKQLAERLHRPLTAVRQKAYDMGMKTEVYKFWTPQELQMLKEIYADTATEDIAVIFNRTAGSVKTKARQLGLRKSESYIKLIKSRPRKRRRQKG